MKNIFAGNKKTEIYQSWKSLVAWSVLGVIFVLVIIMTFMRTPEYIIQTLTLISSQLKYYFLTLHILMILLLGIGIVWRRYRTQFFFVMMFLLSLSSTVVSSIFIVIPNILFFVSITILVLSDFISKKLNWDLKEVKVLDLLFSSIGLIFGFWYLHWIEEPIALNALLYSPLGGVNCPTLVMLTALLILTKRPKSDMLSIFVGSLTLYFGFFGMIRLAAYVDIVLILCGLYLITRVVLNTIFIKMDNSKIINTEKKEFTL